VALLVDNGMSMDYASKIKNKTIERLNEKFEFITGSTINFIQTLKSKEDKRIQVIQMVKEELFSFNHFKIKNPKQIQYHINNCQL
jgi:hypothetical protein